MESNEEAEFYFKQIQSVCVELAKEPTLKNVHQMREVAERIPGELLEKFFSYILFSIRITLKRTRSETNNIDENTKICLIETLNILFSEKYDRLPAMSQFVIDLVSDLIISINLPGTNELIGSKKLSNSVVCCLTRIFEIANDEAEAKNLLGSMKFRPILAHCVSVLLKLLQIEDNDIVLNCLNCLTIIFKLSDSVAASFLPGVSSVLLDALINFHLRIDEYSTKKFSSLFETLTLAIFSAARDELNQTPEWRQIAGLQLKNLCDRISSVFVCCSISKPKLCLLEFVKMILNSNAAILKDCKKRCLEVLATFAFDDQTSNDDVFQKPNTNVIAVEFCSELYANLTSICWRLPRLSRPSIFDIQQRVEWQQFCGCLKLLGSKHLTYFFLNDCQTKLFCRSLCEAIQLNNAVSEINTALSLKTAKVSDAYLTDYCWVYLKQPTDMQARNLVYTSFQLICEISELDVIMENFFDIFRSKPDSKCSAAFALNCILNVLAAKKGSEISLDYLENLLDDYFNWLNNNNIGEKCSDLNTNLALHGVTIISRIINKTSMQSYLVKTLYCLLRLLDFSDTKQSAYTALNSIAAGLQKTSGKNLVLDNLDYLTSSIVTKLKHLSLNSETPNVLSSLLELIELNDIFLLNGAMEECLAAVDRCKENDHTLPILITCLRKFALICKDIPPPADLGKKHLESSPDSGATDDPVNDENTEDTKNIPWHIIFAVNSLHSIYCWLGAKSFSVRMASVEALGATLLCLKFYENQLLPAIHKSWPSVLARINDEEIPSRTAAFNVLFCMAELSGDFVRRRIENELWPLLEKYLHKMSCQSRCAGVVYRQSASYQFQFNICKLLGELCRKIEASNEMIGKCKLALELYVGDKQQPQCLIEAALESIDTLNLLTK